MTNDKSQMTNLMNPNSRVLHMAHILKANRPDFAWSDMVRYAWYFHHFREALKAGVVTFSFFKEDGSIREAKGTLNGVLIPAEDLPKSGADNSSLPARRDSAEVYSAIPFYDIDKKAWRSFSITRFIGFVTCYKLEESGLAKREKNQKRNYQR